MGNDTSGLVPEARCPPPTHTSQLSSPLLARPNTPLPAVSYISHTKRTAPNIINQHRGSHAPTKHPTGCPTSAWANQKEHTK